MAAASNVQDRIELIVTSTYVCEPDEDPLCAEECVSLAECQKCACAVIDTEGGPWGDAVDVILCLLPILFLLGATLKPNPLPTTQSLPLAAVLMFLIRVMYLGSDPLLVCGSIISGLHEALSPLSIMFGAILLFETMEATLCMPYMMREMKALTQGHPVAELMLLFCFAYMVEGASGFGTPAALGAPMLASLGYPKLESVVTLLLMNTFATVWGAAGTPIWFGFGNLNLDEDDFLEISNKAGVALVIASWLLLAPLVLTVSCRRQVLMRNSVFLISSLASVTGPAVGLSFVSYEFPALLGGMVGCVLTAILIQFKVGLREYIPSPEEENSRHPMEINTTSDNHSIISSIRKNRADEENSEQSMRKAGPRKMDSTGLGTVPEEVSAQWGVKRAQSSLSVSLAVGDLAEDGDEEEVLVVSSVKKGTETNGTSNYQVEEKVGTNGVFESDRQVNGSVTEREDKDDVGGTIERGEPLLDSHAAIEAHLGPRKSYSEGYLQELIGRTFPLWGTVLLLVLTRVPQIGLKDLLTRREPNFSIHFGTYGDFKMSASLVLQLNNILTYPQLNWKYELLYVPFLMPFVIIAFLTMILYRQSLQSKPREILGTVASRLKNPAIALMGALVLVQLLINDGPASPASIIGTILSDAMKGGWIAVAAFIGALGSFFSGSTTIANLTFGEIQLIAAEQIGTSETALLALQAAGASAGNGICLNNIIAACAVVGLVSVGEGKVIAKTAPTVISFCVVATVVMLAFFLRF